MNYSLEEILNPKDLPELEPEDILKQHNQQDDIYKRRILMILKAVRSFKSKLIGDIYKDFFEIGIPVPDNIINSNLKERHEFDGFLMTRP